MLLIKGKLRVFGVTDKKLSAIIEANEWTAGLENLSIRALAWVSEDNHTFTSANILSSWTTEEGAFYRYGMINFGRLFSQNHGNDDEIMPWDFVPAFNVHEIAKRIFAHIGYKMDDSSFLKSSLGVSLYVMGKEPTAPSNFEHDKLFEGRVLSNADNSVSDTHAASSPQTLTFSLAKVKFETQVLDEPDKYDETNSKFVIPETGSYRFYTKFRIYSTHNDAGDGWSSITEHFVVQIYNVTTSTVLYQIIGTDTNIFFTSLYDFVVDTGYVKCSANDEIIVRLEAESTATNEELNPRTIEIRVIQGETSMFKNFHDKFNLYKNLGDTITPAAYLPDVNCIDFLKGLRHLFGLRFWADTFKRTIYIRPADQFITSNVVEIDKIDYSDEIKQTYVASEYKKTQILRYKDDSNDKALQNYIHDNGFPFQKIVTLTSENAQEGEETRENPVFAATPDQYFYALDRFYGVDGNIYVPAIYADYDSSSHVYAENRLINWVPRIFEWKGLTSKQFKYNTNYLDTFTLKTQYPKMQCPDISALFKDYYQKHWHYVDNSKLLTCTIIIDMNKLSQFVTVLSDGEKEAFRTIYKITINGASGYYMLNNLVTDGHKAKCEFIQKI